MDYEIVALPESYGLAHCIANKLNKNLIIPVIQEFADKEIEIICNSDQILGKQVVLIHTIKDNAHDNIVRFCLLVHAATIAGASAVIAVIPYLWYTRQDKSNIIGKPGGWHMIARMLKATGISALIGAEIHAPECIDMLNIPFYQVKLNDAIAVHIKTHIPENKESCFIAPDEGAFDRTQEIGQVFNAPVMVFKKKRFDIDKTAIIAVSGACGYDTAIIVDDILGTGGTAINACNKLKEMGVKKVYGYFVHAVLPGSALQRIEESGFEKVFVSNSIPHVFSEHSKIQTFDIGDTLVRMIQVVKERRDEQ